MRLIDADMLASYLNDLALLECPDDRDEGEERLVKDARARVIWDIISVIGDRPTVDAAPVVRSCWKQTDAYPHWLYCLKCYKRIVPNAEWIEDYNVPTNYCPNCGAKMDGGESDERND